MFVLQNNYDNDKIRWWDDDHVTYETQEMHITFWLENIKGRDCLDDHKHTWEDINYSVKKQSGVLCCALDSCG